ncbi:MAG: hypothetical protein JRG79_15215 [Deltaproteobacteria bacterium]|nr:hypothetical protein [Deltaproteobacteria bacterium]
MKRATDNMQTVAVYSEPRIKTYGFNIVTDLLFMELPCSPERLNALGLGIEALGDSAIGFHLVFGQTAEDHAFSLFISAHDSDGVRAHMHRLLKGHADAPSDLITMVDVVSFQGPHFGDRYGVAHAAFQALEAKSVPLLASVCSGACLYLVLPQGKGDEAKALLREAFEVPKNRHGRGTRRKRKTHDGN